MTTWSSKIGSGLRNQFWWLKEVRPEVERYRFLLEGKPNNWRSATDGLPNVILLSIDSMGAKHLGSYGYSRPTSPNMDRIAHSGVLFENVIAQSNWTKPALASILTSLYPFVHKTDAQGETGDRVDVDVRDRSHVLDPRFRTMAEDFRDGGYATAGFSNGGYAHSFFGFGRGFDVYDNEAGGLESCTYRMLRWICRNNIMPFMAWIHAWDVHFPYMDRPPYNRKFVKQRARIVLNASVRHQINSGERDLSAVELEFLRGLYDGAICYADDLIGLIVRELERLGLSDNTVLVITADHGEAFMEHGYIEHTACLHNEVIRVPLILSGPTLPRGRRIRSQVRSIDIMPTLLDLCGLAPKAEVEGTSLLPLIAGAENNDLVAASETERGGGQTAFTDGRYKLIHKHAAGFVQLYELMQDPDEQCDISNTHPGICSAMESQVLSWKQQVASCGDRYWCGHTPGPAIDMQRDLIGRLRDLGYIE